MARALQAQASAGSPRYLAFAMATAFIVGVMQIAMGAARLGVLTNFLSQPVLSGFTSAAALILTFVAVLALGIAKGILIGVASTIILHLWRTSRPPPTAPPRADLQRDQFH